MRRKIMNKKSPDLLLVNPGGRKRIYQSLSSQLAAIEPPIWAGLMATYARNQSVSVEILDSNGENLDAQETAQRIDEIKPLLVAVVVYGHNPSASTQVMPVAGHICQEIKALTPNQPILLLGGHVSALPERTLREEMADFTCGGEGLVTLVELVLALKSGNSSDIEKVSDLWYEENGKICNNPPAPLNRNINQNMPEIAWDLLPMSNYRAHNWHCFGDLEREPYAAIYTTLGCPYRCTFCCIQAPFNSGERLAGYKAQVNSYRFWTPEVVIKQIDTLVQKYNVRNIKFADEMFVLNSNHVTKICNLIIERDYDLNIWAYARVDTTKEKMIDKLKKAGINWLAFGIEAANERVRDDVEKGFSQYDIFSTIRSVQEGGINIGANYIFGLPEDTLESMQQTLDLAIEINAEYSNFYSAMAYPGSQLYTEALINGVALPESWSGYSQHSYETFPLPTKHLTSSEVLSFRDQAFDIYFNSQSYLSMIEEKFGTETVAHIKQMASHKLDRKHA